MQISIMSHKINRSIGSNQKSARFMTQRLTTELALLTIGVLDSARKQRSQEKTEMDYHTQWVKHRQFTLVKFKGGKEEV